MITPACRQFFLMKVGEGGGACLLGKSMIALSEGSSKGCQMVGRLLSSRKK